MTFLDTPPPMPAPAETAPSRSSGDQVDPDDVLLVSPGRPGIWRALSMLVVMGSTVIVVLWVLAARDASDRADRNGRTLDLEPMAVSIDESLPTPAGATVTVLGIDRRAGIEVAGENAEVEVPTTVASMIALVTPDGSIHGLAAVGAGSDRAPITISAASTARALLATAPALLQADVARTIDNVDVIAGDPAFDSLVEALESESNISVSNQPVESAVAAILDRVPARRPLPDQGCDSVLARRAYAATGACVVPGSGRATITNEQDRWALLYSGPEPWGAACAIIAPAGTPGSEVAVEADDCGAAALFVAPGPITDPSPSQEQVNLRISTATGIQIVGDYMSPLVDLLGASAGFNQESNAHLLVGVDHAVAAVEAARRSAVVEDSLAALIGPANPIESHTSTITITRALTNTVEISGLIHDWDPAASAHAVILDFHDRVGSHMRSSTRTDWRWSANSSGVIELATDP